jgi:hypothetical protein
MSTGLKSQKLDTKGEGDQYTKKGLTGSGWKRRGGSLSRWEEGSLWVALWSLCFVH